jgi:hypothetical protein
MSSTPDTYKDYADEYFDKIEKEKEAIPILAKNSDEFGGL